MRITDKGIEDTVEWTIIAVVIVGAALLMIIAGNAITQSLTNASM